MVHFIGDPTSGYAIREFPISRLIVEPPEFLQARLENHRIVESFGVGLVARRRNKGAEFLIRCLKYGKAKLSNLYVPERAVQPIRFSNQIRAGFDWDKENRRSRDKPAKERRDHLLDN